MNLVWRANVSYVEGLLRLLDVVEGAVRLATVCVRAALLCVRVVTF